MASSRLVQNLEFNTHNTLCDTPCCQNSLSWSGFVAAICLYIAKVRLPATCFGLPYPKKLVNARKIFLVNGDVSTFRVSQFFAEFCSGGKFVVTEETVDLLR